MNKNFINGIDAGKMRETAEKIKAEPKIAAFKFRVANTWIDGTHCRATVKGFYGALKEDDSRPETSYDFDEPPVLLGNNAGNNPVEYALVALSGCLTTALVAHATMKGIEIRGLKSRYEGDLDVRGFLGLADDVPVGFSAIRVYFTIDADIPDDRKRELLQMAQRYSPVFNMLTKETPVSCDLDKDL